MFLAAHPRHTNLPKHIFWPLLLERVPFHQTACAGLDVVLDDNPERGHEWPHLDEHGFYSSIRNASGQFGQAMTKSALLPWMPPELKRCACAASSPFPQSNAISTRTLVVPVGNA